MLTDAYFCCRRSFEQSTLLLLHRRTCLHLKLGTLQPQKQQLCGSEVAFMLDLFVPHSLVSETRLQVASWPPRSSKDMFDTTLAT